MDFLLSFSHCGFTRLPAHLFHCSILHTRIYIYVCMCGMVWSCPFVLSVFFFFFFRTAKTQTVEQGDQADATHNEWWLAISIYCRFFRDISQNNLTELPPGIFDSLVALNDLWGYPSTLLSDGWRASSLVAAFLFPLKAGTCPLTTCQSSPLTCLKSLQTSSFCKCPAECLTTVSISWWLFSALKKKKRAGAIRTS